jgi:hypothetical protein
MKNRAKIPKKKHKNEDYISRQELCARWGCSLETLKRREKAGILHPAGFSERMVRYRLSEVLAVEREAFQAKPHSQRVPRYAGNAIAEVAQTEVY